MISGKSAKFKNNSCFEFLENRNSESKNYIKFAMSIKITVDNNFFDSLIKFTDAKAKDRLINAFKNKKLSFYPSLQLIIELTNLYNTKRKDLLLQYSIYFLEIMGYRCLNDWNNIIRNELGIESNEGIFLSSSHMEQIKNIFINLSKGRILKNLKKVIEQENLKKEKQYKSFKESRQRHLKILTEQKIKTPRMSFDDFYKMPFAVQMRKDLIRDLFNRAKKPISEEKVNKIVDNSIDYPYFYISSKVFMGIFYRHIILKRSVSKGDNYDQYYLIYLTNLDYLVSEDKGLKEFSSSVFKKQKVINFCELINLICNS